MAAMNLEVTETQVYGAWRGLEAITRSRADNAVEREASVTPAMVILEAVLTELGYTIVDRQLMPVSVEEEGALLRERIDTLPAEPGIDNTLPPEPEAKTASKPKRRW